MRFYYGHGNGRMSTGCLGGIVMTFMLMAYYAFTGTLVIAFSLLCLLAYACSGFKWKGALSAAGGIWTATFSQRKRRR